MTAASRLALSLFVLVTLPAAALGQQYRGHLRGTILNPAGIPAAGVQMRITSESTGETRQFASRADGTYVVADLLPGTYRISSDDDRYRDFAMRTAVAIGHDAHLDLRLGLSTVTMGADVRPTHIPVDRFGASQTMRLQLAFVERLPLESRDYLDAAALAPGMTPRAGGVAAAGTSSGFTGYVVDGLTWSTAGGLGAPPTRMPLDAVAQLEVRTSTFDAPFGHAAGAQVNIVTRSGGNRSEGGAYGLLQPDGERALGGGFGGGALAASRTFGFASYQFSTVDGREGDGHLLAGRADHLLGASRLTGRYSLDSTPASGHAQTAAVALHTAGRRAWTNEVRLGIADTSATRIRQADDDSSALQLANVTSYSYQRHLVRGGINISRLTRDVGEGDGSAATVGLFVQDDWWLRPDLTVSAGARYDRFSPDGDRESSNHVSPRVGVAWIADDEARTLVRAGYGLAYHHLHLEEDVPSFDMWSVSVRRFLGRARALEAAYVGSRGDEILAGRGTSTYDALQITLEERSETNVAALVTYTYGRWNEDLPSADDEMRAPLDARHRITASFVAGLPFGEERRWFDDGLAAEILGNLEISGIFRLRSGLPLPGEPGTGDGQRSIDAAIVKTIALGLTRALQLRLEAYNFTDREDLPRGRRYQLGGRVVF